MLRPCYPSCLTLEQGTNKQGERALVGHVVNRNPRPTRTPLPARRSLSSRRGRSQQSRASSRSSRIWRSCASWRRLDRPPMHGLNRRLCCVHFVPVFHRRYLACRQDHNNQRSSLRLGARSEGVAGRDKIPVSLGPTLQKSTIDTYGVC